MSVPWRSFAHSASALLALLCFAATSICFADDKDEKKKPVKETRSEDAGPAVALLGGRVHTMSAEGVIEADILIRGGKVVAVGKGLDIPQDAKRISIKGMNATPGLIDVRSSLWLTSAATRESSSSGYLAVLDGVDPFAEDWREVAKQGVTTVYVQPGPSGTLGGSGAALRVAAADSVDALTIATDVGAQSSLGVGGRTTTSRDRYAQYASLKKVLEAAKKYDDEWKKYEEYEKKQAEAKKKSKPGDKKDAKPGDKKDAKSDDKKSADAPMKKAEPKKEAPKKEEAKKEEPKKETPKKEEPKKDAKADAAKKTDAKSAKPPQKPKRDPAKDFLRNVIQRKTPLRLEAHRHDDIANALKLAKELKIRIVLEGASKPGTSLQQLLDSRVPLVLGPFAETGSTPSYRRGREDDWATPLARGDARWAIATFSSEPRGSRLLRVHAALAVANGVKPNLALRAITKDAAEILGLGEQAGTISKGKRADLAVFAGHPLDPSAQVVLTMSGGEITHQQDKPAAAGVEAKVSGLPESLPEAYAVRSQRVLRNGKLAPATLIVRNGKLAAIRGGKAEVKNMPVYDCGAAVITPGLVSAYSELGQGGLIDDDADAVTPDIQAADAFDPTLASWDKFAEAGFLSIGFSPGSTNIVSGHTAVVQTGDAELTAPTAALKIILTSASRRTNRYPASLAGQVELVRQVFGGQMPASRLLLPPEIESQLMNQRREAIQDAAAGKRRVLLVASQPAEVRAAIDLVEEFKLAATLVYPTEIKPFVDDLKRLKIGVIARTANVGDYDRYLEELAEASAAGVQIGFGGETPMACRLTASMAVSLGMPQSAAMSALTSTAAQLAGGDQNVGRLNAKQAANFVVWDGSPLDLCRKPLHVVVGGQLRSDED